MSTAAAARDAMRRLPLIDVAALLGGATPVILAPHPDDDIIGCGGLIAQAARGGIMPVIVYVTDGSGSHPGSRAYPPERLARLREQEAAAAAGILGVPASHLHFLRLRDTAAPREGAAFDRAVRDIAAIVVAHRPALLLAPWRADPHGDHVAVHAMAQAVARMTGVPHLSFPVWGWTLPADADVGDAAIAGCRVAVGDDRALRLRALHAHRSQMSDLIDDDPKGFRLDQATLAAMLSDHEVFLVNP